MGDAKQAKAFILNEETIPEIEALTGIDSEVLRGWLKYDLSFSLSSKIIVVETTRG